MYDCWAKLEILLRLINLLDLYLWGYWDKSEMFIKCLVRWGTLGKESVFERVAKALIIKGVLLLRGRVESPIEIRFSFA